MSVVPVPPIHKGTCSKTINFFGICKPGKDSSGLRQNIGWSISLCVPRVQVPGRYCTSTGTGLDICALLVHPR